MRRRAILAVVLASGLLFTGEAPSLAQSPEGVAPELFSAAPRAPRIASRESRDEVMNSWRGRIQSELLRAPATRLRVSLPDGRSFGLSLDEFQDDRFNGQAWIGWVDGSPRRRAIFMVDGDMITGHVSLGERSLEVRPLGGGGHAVDEVLGAALPGGAEPLIAPPSARSTSSDAQTTQVDDGSIFDVLVLYTRNTAAGAGSARAMRNLIKLGVTETNVAFADSNVVPRIRLIKHAQDPYVESRDAITDLGRLVRRGDGHWNKLDALRDRFGADFVVGIVELISIGGIANVMEGVDPDFAERAVSIVRRLNISPGYSFAHELGHNFGLRHARTDSASIAPPTSRVPRAYRFSYGYDDVAGRWRTIMAQQPPGVRILHFSNPKVDFEDRPTGVKHTRADGADARLSINRASGVLANFRACARRCE